MPIDDLNSVHVITYFPNVVHVVVNSLDFTCASCHPDVFLPGLDVYSKLAG